MNTKGEICNISIDSKNKINNEEKGLSVSIHSSDTNKGGCCQDQNKNQLGACCRGLSLEQGCCNGPNPLVECCTGQNRQQCQGGCCKGQSQVKKGGCCQEQKQNQGCYQGQNQLKQGGCCSIDNNEEEGCCSGDDCEGCCSGDDCCEQDCFDDEDK